MVGNSTAVTCKAASGLNSSKSNTYSSELTSHPTSEKIAPYEVSKADDFSHLCFSKFTTKRSSDVFLQDAGFLDYLRSNCTF